MEVKGNVWGSQMSQLIFDAEKISFSESQLHTGDWCETCCEVCLPAEKTARPLQGNLASIISFNIFPDFSFWNLQGIMSLQGHEGFDLYFIVIATKAVFSV